MIHSVISWIFINYFYKCMFPILFRFFFNLFINYLFQVFSPVQRMRVLARASIFVFFIMSIFYVNCCLIQTWTLSMSIFDIQLLRILYFICLLSIFNYLLFQVRTFMVHLFFFHSPQRIHFNLSYEWDTCLRLLDSKLQQNALLQAKNQKKL